MNYLITLMLFLFSFSSYSLELVNAKIDSVEIVKEQVRELNEKFGSNNVLVVFDIDNTVLTTKEEIASDQWFEWQWEMISENSEYAVADTHKGLLKLLKSLYELSTFILAEGDMTKDAVDEFIRNDNKFFYLTSRNHSIQEVTQDALIKNDIHFRDSEFNVPSLSKSISPLHLGNEKLIASYSKQRLENPVLYSQNVFYTAGLHKGMMLKTFLKHSNWEPKAIVFMDDKLKHTAGMQEEFSDTDIEVYSYTYDHLLPQVVKFYESDKKKIHMKYMNLVNLKFLN